MSPLGTHDCEFCKKPADNAVKIVFQEHGDFPSVRKSEGGMDGETRACGYHIALLFEALQSSGEDARKQALSKLQRDKRDKLKTSQ